MKYLKEYENWADDIISEAKDERPLPIDKDLLHSATQKFPGYSPEQALILFLADKIENNEKTDSSQTNAIRKQQRDSQSIHSELDNLEQDEMNIEKELNRIRALSNRLK